MDKQELRNIIGKQIRKERKNCSMTSEELAELIGISTSHLGLIERGERGVTAYNFYKLSKIFNISIDDIFFRDEDASLRTGKTNAPTSYKAKRVDALIKGMDEKEIDFIIKMIKAITRMRNFN